MKKLNPSSSENNPVLKSRKWKKWAAVILLTSLVIFLIVLGVKSYINNQKYQCGLCPLYIPAFSIERPRMTRCDGTPWCQAQSVSEFQGKDVNSICAAWTNSNRESNDDLKIYILKEDGSLVSQQNIPATWDLLQNSCQRAQINGITQPGIYKTIFVVAGQRYDPNLSWSIKPSNP